MLTCGTWVKRGIAKEVPDKVELSKEEIEQLMNETRKRVKENEEELDTKEKEEKLKTSVIKDEEENDELTEYDLDNYDDDDGEIMSGAGMAGLSYFASNSDDPYITMKNIDEDDRDDFVIKPTDNLIVIGKMEDEYCNLEVHVFNEEEGSMYVHHDIMLESVPLALEWLSFDPTSQNQTGNFAAVGTMDPQIDVWDLDVVDTMEPVFTLGKKIKKKKNKKKASSASATAGHEDAVLGLSWNRNARNVLASGSADETVILWDMNVCKCVHTLRHHKDKVQCLQWHPYESQSLLTGSFDQTVQVLDCRNPESCTKSWKLNGEVEQTAWNHCSPFNFLASTDQGDVYYFDVRQDTPVFQISAHDGPVTGMSLSSQIPGCLVTASSDKMVKVWDFKEGSPVFVMSKDMKMGRLHFAAACPDTPYGFCFGGEKDGIRVLDLSETTAGKQHFGKSNVGVKQENQSTDKDTEKDTDKDKDKDKGDAVDGSNIVDAEMAENAFASLSLKMKPEPKDIVKKKKKKKGTKR